MHFLNQDILLELLNTYTGEDLTEEKSYSNSKFKKWFTSAIDVGKSMIGINTNSKTWYFKLRGHIIKATEGDLETWGDLIIDAGKAGFQTHTDSIIGSKLCQSALALRSIVLNQVNNMLQSIPYQRLQFLGENEDPPTELNKSTLVLKKRGKNLILYWSYNDKIMTQTLKLSDSKELIKKIYNKDPKELVETQLIYDVLFKFFVSQDDNLHNLSSEQLLALQIRDVINQRIEEQKSFIEDANKNIERNKHKPNLEFDKLESNEDILKYKKNSEENIKIRQRNLCYLNAYEYLKQKKYQVCTQETKPLKELMRELFPKFKFYNFSSTELNDDTTKKMDSDLPLFLQPNYDSIYLRSKEADPKKQKHSDERIVNRFQEEALKNTASSNKIKKVKESKSDFSIVKTPTPNSSPVNNQHFSMTNEEEHDESDFEFEDKSLELETTKQEIKKNSPTVKTLNYENILKNLPALTDFSSELTEAPFIDKQPLLQIDNNDYFTTIAPEPSEVSPKLKK